MFNQYESVFSIQYADKEASITLDGVDLIAINPELSDVKENSYSVLLNEITKNTQLDGLESTKLAATLIKSLFMTGPVIDMLDERGSKDDVFVYLELNDDLSPGVTGHSLKSGMKVVEIQGSGEGLEFDSTEGAKKLFESFGDEKTVYSIVFLISGEDRSINWYTNSPKKKVILN